MKIIISPAKKMNIDTDTLQSSTVPMFSEEAEMLWEYLKNMTYEELRSLWKCNEKIASLGYERLHGYDLKQSKTPAILAYEGIQYQYMAPMVFSDEALAFADSHLCILSGLYGMLRPSDAVVPYRLEMQAKLVSDGGKDLYGFWGDKIYRELTKESKTIVNLASKEYSKVLEPYLTSDICFLTCIFGEETGGKVKVKGTLAKMARGEMVKWICAQRIEHPDELKQFTGLGYQFSTKHSTESEYVFLAGNTKEI